MLASIKYIAKLFIKNILDYKHLRLTPKKQSHDDLYLVSFPKSGSMWLSFLMANINALQSSSLNKITHFNIENWITDIHYTRNVSESLKFRFPFYRIFKSHSKFNPYYRSVIYLIRDPRDVMISYHKFLLQLNSYSGSLSDLIRDKKYGIREWAEHLDSWWNLKSTTSSIQFVRYEDMKDNSFKILDDLYSKSLGLNINPEIIRQAITESNFEKLKNEEKDYYLNRNIDKNFVHFRKGKSNEWGKSLSESDLKYINKHASKYMKLFSYL